MSLGNTLVIVAIMAILAFTVAAVSLYHLTFTSKISNGQLAQNLAESTVNLAIKEVMKNPTVGVSRDVLDDVVLQQTGGGLGHLTFNQAQALRWKIDYSTNNLEGPNSVPGYNPDRPVPKAATQLVATGTVGGVTRRVEAVLYIPPFPYAIATAGPFRSGGGLQVGAVTSAATLNSIASIDPSQLVSANLASNALGAGSLVLGPNSRITGDVRSAGSVQIDPSDIIGGQVRSNGDPVAIPREDVKSYDPLALGKPNIQNLTPGSIDAPVYQGFVRSPGDIQVTNGLKLDNGVLYVDGNLKVGGGIQGSGAVFVTGKTSLTGASNITTDNTVAIMSKGDVTISGTSQYSSFFQGLLYTEGNFVAQQVSLLGVFIQNGGAGTSVNITDGKLISVSEYSKIDVPVAVPGKPATAASANIFLNTDGTQWNGIYGPNGPVVLEAYPVASGGYEMIDPNTRALTSYADMNSLGHAVKKLLEDNWKAGKKMLAWTDAQGHTTLLRVGNPSDSTARSTMAAELGPVPPRPTHTSYILSGTPASTDDLVVDPSRFLSLKDRAKIIYWRAR